MRSTAPAAVAASISCSRARLVALRRQVWAVPAVHITIGRISATQSSRFRSAARCRSPQHARRREVPSRSTRPTTSDPIVQLGMSWRARAAPCRRPYRPGCRAESPRSLRRRTLAARNGSPAHALSSVSGRLRRSAGRGGFSVVGEQRAKFGPRGPHGPPETAVRVDLPPWRAAFPASYAAISTCRRLTFNARHTRSHSQRTFASPRKLKRRKPSACLIQP